MNDMKELTSPEIEALEIKANELSKEQNKIINKIKKLKQKLINLDFVGKYIRYTDMFDSTPIYMKVDFIRTDVEFSDIFDYSYEFVGAGFWGEFTGYDDATELDWSYWFRFNIHGNEKDFLKRIDSIEVITKEEFDEAFELMIETMKEYHYKIK